MSKKDYSFIGGKNGKKEAEKEPSVPDIGQLRPAGEPAAKVVKVIKKNGKKKKRGKIIFFSALGFLLAVLITIGIYLYIAIEQPKSLFNTSSKNELATPKPMNENIDDTVAVSPSANPTPTPEPFSGEHIVNVLLMGLDLDYKTYAADGGNYHTDSIIVLAINFDKGIVDMISLPRDTFTHIPGIKGVYKLNAAINCGGGKTEGGFKKVCETASWMLGGISIDYYYAFELDTVIEIGDMIGGVDFKVDMNYTGSSGKKYRAGMQHLDGKGIYDYMRARKNAPGGTDEGRMNRCKAMLKAIFQKLKDQNMLTQIPELLSTVNKGLYTNVTLQQSIALANFAYSRVNADSIASHTMEGELKYAMGYKFFFIDQKARKEFIKQVYGIDVPEQQYVSSDYAKWLYYYGFKTIRYLASALELSQYIQNKGIDTFSPKCQDSYNALIESYNKTQAAYDAAALSLSGADNSVMEKARNDLRRCTLALAELVGYPHKLSWTIKSGENWNQESCLNEVFVDFK